MYYVYILRDRDNEIYIGYSSNLKRRLSEHQRQKVYTSKRMVNPQLFYYEAYTTEILAKDREYKLKQRGSSIKGLLKRLGCK